MIFLSKKIKILIGALFCIVIVACFLFFSQKEKREVIEKNKSEIFKIGLITDVHGTISSENDDAISKKSKEPLLKFIERMNESFKPDFVVDNGDFIEGSFREGEKSIRDFKILNENLKKINAPILHVVGNHEMRGFSIDKWKNLTENKSSYYYMDKNNLRIIILDGNDKGRVSSDNNGYYHTSEDQFSWLEELLENSNDFRKIIFIHFPLTEAAIDGSQKVIFPENTQRLKNIISNFGISAVFTGHTEKLSYEKINGVEYFSLPGFSKSKSHKVNWIGSFYEIKIGEKIEVRMFYKKNDLSDQYRELIIPSEEYYKIER